jgi:hypothetical protein
VAFFLIEPWSGWGPGKYKNANIAREMFLGKTNTLSYPVLYEYLNITCQLCENFFTLPRLASIDIK